MISLHCVKNILSIDKSSDVTYKSDIIDLKNKENKDYDVCYSQFLQNKW